MAPKRTRPIKLKPDEEDELAAWRLARWLQAGGALPTVHPSLPPGGWIALGEHEACRHQTAGTLYAFTSAEAAYSQGWFVAGGSTKMVAGSLAASALYNHRQRRRAETFAAEQWRPVANGFLLVTTHRLIVATTQWVSLYYADFEYAHLQYLAGPAAAGPGIRFGVRGSDALFLQVPGQNLWLFVLLTYLSHGVVNDVQLRAALVQKLEQARAGERELVSSSGAIVPLDPL
jgi:hypothetical protein